MNTKPDDTQILLWLEDELDPTESTRIEAWITDHMPQQLEQRAQLRSWKAQLRAATPADEEIPYADFFQHRVMNAIQSQARVTATTATPVPAIPSPAAQPTSSRWEKWLAPSMAAAACAILSFIAGRMTTDAPTPTIITYTPEIGVQADYYPTSPAEATVIVLNGVDELPDSLIEQETASVESPATETPESPISTVTP